MEKKLTREEYHRGLIGTVPKKWHIEMLEEFDRDDNWNNFKQEYMDKKEKAKVKEDELIHKRMNDINTFQAHENEVYLRGTDEHGKDFQICFDSYNFLEWIDTEHLKYIKKQLIKHIKKI